MGKYDVTVTITGYEQDRFITWEVSGEGFPSIGHYYGYRLEPADGGHPRHVDLRLVRGRREVEAARHLADHPRVGAEGHPRHPRADRSPGLRCQVDRADPPGRVLCWSLNRRGPDGLGLLDRPGVPEEARLGGGVLPRGGRAARLRVPVRGPLEGPEDQGAGQGPPGPGQGAGPVGDLPRRGARRARATASSSSACSTRSSVATVGPADVRRRRARHRQHGDARRVRHRGAEGALAQAAARTRRCSRRTR